MLSESFTGRRRGCAPLRALEPLSTPAWPARRVPACKGGGPRGASAAAERCPAAEPPACGNSQVREIITEGEGAAARAVGVRLADGRVFRGRTVVSNATRWDTFDGLLPPERLPEPERLFRRGRRHAAPRPRRGPGARVRLRLGSDARAPGSLLCSKRMRLGLPRGCAARRRSRICSPRMLRVRAALQQGLQSVSPSAWSYAESGILGQLCYAARTCWRPRRAGSDTQRRPPSCPSPGRGGAARRVGEP